MPQPRLVSARWLKNHGVALGYAGNGASGPIRYVPPDGELTVGQAAKLLKIYPLQVYRLEARGVLRFRNVKGVAMVPLSELRKKPKG